MPTERKTKLKKKAGTSSPSAQVKKNKARAKTTSKSKKTAAPKRTVKSTQPKASATLSAPEQPIPGRDLIISATKIAIGTRRKASRLFQVAGNFISNQKDSGKSMIQGIGKNQQVRRVIDIAGVIPQKVKEFRQNRKSTKN